MNAFLQLPIVWFVLGSLVLRASDAFDTDVQPIMQEYCISCHSTKDKQGELDLQRFTSEKLARQDAEVWQRVLEQLDSNTMPPEEATPLPQHTKQIMTDWISHLLDDIALENTGDPGPVLLRRLSNHEYTYTIRDITGIDTLDPARDFPVDGAAGEGFTNVGDALVMSPPLLTKYLDAAKEIAAHAVMLPDGIRFSASKSPQDWTTEALQRIQHTYAKYTLPTSFLRQVEGTGDVSNVGGVIPLQRYLDALQANGSKDGLSEKYLDILRTALQSHSPSPLLEPLRAKYAQSKLTTADIEPWSKALWKFSTVGHIGRANGPQAWQEPVSPLVEHQELRYVLSGNEDQTLYLVATTAGDGASGDKVVWENPRLVAPNRIDIPVSNLPALVQRLEKERERILSSAEFYLAALATENMETLPNLDPTLMSAWRNYLGLGATQLAPLLTQRIERTADYEFIRGWNGGGDLSVLANSSEASVRIPGVMAPHSIAVHPAPDRSIVIAWKSPVAGPLTIHGELTHAHPECGNGIAWKLEVQRGLAAEAIASGIVQGPKSHTFGAFHDVSISEGQVVALVTESREGNHACDLTKVTLTISHGDKTWDLTSDVSPNILLGNPNGPWHFLSQPSQSPDRLKENSAISEWLKTPSPETARQVKAHLQGAFPLTHPLLNHVINEFTSSAYSNVLATDAPSAVAVRLPMQLARGSEFVVTGKLASGQDGSVQLRITEKEITEEGKHVAIPSAPVVVNKNSDTSKAFDRCFEEFRTLFPMAACYTSIVPVDEVVTLTLYHREDHLLKTLMLNETESQELDRLWDELLFVSEAPLKQVDAFIQLEQYATQDRPELLAEFAGLRKRFDLAAEEFKLKQVRAATAQKQSILMFAEKAWRRPLTMAEQEQVSRFAPTTMLTYLLTSPHFLYKGEDSLEKTGPVNDFELAARLSYFLWSSAPDEELLRAAKQGQLRNQQNLESQVKRMLADDRLRRLATEFGCQWLQVRDISALEEKSDRHFPTFVDIRADLQEEVTRFFVDLFQNNRSPLSLIDANHLFANEALALHYGIKPKAQDWMRYDGAEELGRGGALAFGATLAKNSGASRTSAILRGTWISEVILGDKLPNPPKGVPVLPEEPQAGLSERQIIEKHSSDSQCAACHRRIDPYGFALEGFDAIGRRRDADTQTVLYDGTRVDGLEGLKRYLASTRREDVLRQFCRKLLGYALGRSVQLSDKPLIDQMMREQGAADIVLSIVSSRQFQERRGAP